MSKNTNALQHRNTEKYLGSFGAIMSMVGMCVGLGNVWRFPYMVGANGGGAFVLAYLLCVLIVVIPMAVVEAGYGKGIGKGLIEAYGAALKKKVPSKIIGSIGGFVYFSMNFFFVPVMAISLYFIYVCARSLWNDIPAEQIYELGLANYPMMIALVLINTLIIGVVIYRGVGGGIESISKVMVPLMVLFFVILILFGAFKIDGIGKGYDFLLNPDFSVWAHPSLWVAAMGQALFSIGVGPGCVLIYGSHLKKGDDVTLTMTSVALFDTTIAVLAGMAMIPACIAMGIQPDQGAKRIFVILPALFQQLPFGALLGVLIFLAIWFAAVTSAIAQSEIPLVTYMHGYNITRQKLAIILSVITAVMACIAVYSDAFLNFWSNLAGNYGFIITAGVGAIVYGWVYGADRIREEFLNPTSDIQLGRWFGKYVKVVVIPVLIIIMANSLFPFLG